VLKKILLVVASLAVIAIGYQIYRWQDESLPVPRQREIVVLPPKPSGPSGTQPAQPGGGGIPIRQAWIGAGQSPVLHVYDKNGNTKIVFRAARWDPVSDNEFDLVEPAIRLTLPGGQLAYVRADEGRMVVQQGENQNPVPKRGHLSGNVRLFLDLTDQEWREAHPNLADLEQHPDSVLKMWLDYVRFDLDLSLLDSDGELLLQSPQGDLEGKGLRLLWSEVGRKIEQLVITEGRRAVLRNIDLAGVSFSRGKAGKSAATAPAVESVPPRPAASAPAPTPIGKRMVRVVQPTEPGDLPYIEVTGSKVLPRQSRVDSYRLVFHDHVVVQQKEAGRIVGGLDNADVLDLLFDINPGGRKTLGRSMTQPAATSRPATAPAEAKNQLAQARSVIELHWTGPLEVVPAISEPATQPEGSVVARMQVTARGSPLEIHRRDAGRAECRELEYHDETRQVWLRGSEQAPVRLEPSQRQQLVAQGTIWVDQKNGKARIDGPGHLVDRGEEGPDTASSPKVVEGLAAADFRNAEFSWNRSVDLEFGLVETAETRPAADISPIPKGAYLKHAVFEGGGTFSEQRRSITADHFDVTFAKPKSTAGPGDLAGSMVIEHVVASGHVRMIVKGDDAVETVDCERLDVDMGLDDTGKNVPLSARVTGHAVARRVGRAAKWGPGAVRDVVLREIRAEEELILDMASVPKPVAAEELARFEANARAAAEQRGIAPGSDEWKRQETRLRGRLDRLANRRQTVPTRVRAREQVTVFDRKQELDLAADSIDCELGREREEIRRALVVGSEARPARVEMADFGIRGPRISVDATTQSAEVPGAGSLRFMTKQDLDGRMVDKPIPVLVTWEKRMWLAGERDTGRIIGNVHAVSENVTLDCRDEMQLQFENVAPAAKAASRPSGPDPRWVFGLIADAVRSGNREVTPSRAGRQIRKRLVSLDAVGDAVILASARDEVSASRNGAVTQWLKPIEDRLVRLVPASNPSTPPPAPRTRLSGRVRVDGPHIVIGLSDKQMLVDGAGHLLIEDYRVQQNRRRAKAADPGSAMLGGGSPSMSLDSIGPGQTLFTWTHSMSFLNSRNTAIFDRDVQMIHLSGSKMYELDRLAAALGVDRQRLQDLPAREAGLSCDHFTVEFERDAGLRRSEPSPLSRATRLKGFSASGHQVRLEENGRSVEGTEIHYDGVTETGRLTGSPEFPATFRERDSRTGQESHYRVEQFDWDQRTGIINVRRPQGVSAGR
jgi:hypothetical protein